MPAAARAGTTRSQHRLGELAKRDRDRNGFGALRLIAAGCVLFAHSFALTGHREPGSPPAGGWGGMGVLMFFSISGFLIAQSWHRDPSVLSFTVKRTLRLMPALATSVLLTAFLLGPIVTSLPLAAYLGDGETWSFVTANLTFQTFYGLPGVFAHATYPDAVNGSLWTLPLELKAYGFVVAVGSTGLLARRPGYVLALSASIAVLLVAPIAAAGPLGRARSRRSSLCRPGPTRSPKRGTVRTRRGSGPSPPSRSPPPSTPCAVA
jgi:peptidoglycan/LPS O-acetylase OafA/YrhL